MGRVGQVNWAVSVAATIATFLSGCGGRTSSSDLDALQVGVAESVVQEVLGEPDFYIQTHRGFAALYPYCGPRASRVPEATQPGLFSSGAWTDPQVRCNDHNSRYWLSVKTSNGTVVSFEVVKFTLAELIDFGAEVLESAHANRLAAVRKGSGGLEVDRLRTGMRRARTTVLELEQRAAAKEHYAATTMDVLPDTVARHRARLLASLYAAARERAEGHAADWQAISRTVSPSHVDFIENRARARGAQSALRRTERDVARAGAAVDQLEREAAQIGTAAKTAHSLLPHARADLKAARARKAEAEAVLKAWIRLQIERLEQFENRIGALREQKRLHENETSLEARCTLTLRGEGRCYFTNLRSTEGGVSHACGRIHVAIADTLELQTSHTFCSGAVPGRTTVSLDAFVDVGSCASWATGTVRSDPDEAEGKCWIVGFIPDPP